MIYETIKGLSKPLPRIIFGALPLAEPDAATFSLLDSIVELGCYALDTAPAYGDGASERVIGKWMEARNNRSDIIIVGKGAHPDGEVNRVDRESIKQDLEGSLSRLKTGYVDLYLLHRDDLSVPVGPIIDALNDLKSEGKIILFGASNWNQERLEEARRYAEENGLEPFAAVSNQYSLAVQYDDPYPGTWSVNGADGASELEWYRETQYPLLAWSSLARGFFSGKFTRDNLADFTDPQSLISVRCYAREDNFVRLDRARQLAAQKGMTVPQIALAYIFQQSLNCFAITGAMNAVQLGENIDALELGLTKQEVDWLDLTSDTLD